MTEDPGGPLGPQTMVERLRLVAVKPPSAALAHSRPEEWRDLGWHAPLDPDAAEDQHRRLVSILEGAGAEVILLGPDGRTGLDSMYAHDCALVVPAGVVPLCTGKPQRRGEGPALATALVDHGIPVLGGLDDPAAHAEGGDCVWLDAATLVVGRGFRTDAAGVGAISRLVEPTGVEVISVDLPYWRGPADVLHLMSFISMVDHDLAVVHLRLLPVALYELLVDRAIELVEVPDEELATQGTNVLALAPRHVLMLDGNPMTRARLEAAGCRVETYDGSEISLKGDGGPTCLTRPLRRG